MLKSKYLLGILLGALTSFFVSANPFDESVFRQLDYGLYWAGEDNQYEKAGSESAAGSNFYDPTRPTLIYVHGWQNGSTEELSRELFLSTDSGRPDIDFAQMWRNAGYNIGVLYWNQFADEGEVQDAEAKIWSVDGPRAMRWRDADGNYHQGPSENVTEILLDSYLAAMANFSGSDLRIAGHSLGNQVALRLTDSLLALESSGEISPALLPQRVALLDAFYSRGRKDYLNRAWTGEVARDIASRLIDAAISIESYRTSMVTSTIMVGDENRGLHNMVAFAELGTGFFNQFQQTQKHVAAVWLYLWSFDFAAPDVAGYQQPGISAASSSETVRFWMNADRRIVQDEGRNSETPEDNTFETRGRL